MLADKIYDYLQTFPGMVALVGQRIYADEFPQIKSSHPLPVTMPAIVYQDITTNPNYSHSGDSGLDNAVYQFSCWAKTPFEARTLAQQVRTVFGGVTTTFSGTKFTGFIEAVKPKAPEVDTGLSRVIVDVRFLHT